MYAYSKLNLEARQVYTTLRCHCGNHGRVRVRPSVRTQMEKAGSSDITPIRRVIRLFRPTDRPTDFGERRKRGREFIFNRRTGKQCSTQIKRGDDRVFYSPAVHPSLTSSRQTLARWFLANVLRIRPTYVRLARNYRPGSAHKRGQPARQGWQFCTISRAVGGACLQN